MIRRWWHRWFPAPMHAAPRRETRAILLSRIASRIDGTFRAVVAGPVLPLALPADVLQPRERYPLISRPEPDYIGPAWPYRFVPDVPGCQPPDPFVTALLRCSTPEQIDAVFSGARL